MSNGVIIYEGPSLLDGQPIVAIATMGSKNSKTGDMVQTWIMRSDIEPHQAVKTGDDSSVCGNCPHRPLNHGSCYVTTFQAPLSIYRAYKRGRYAKASHVELVRLGLDRVVRMGSYGDPAAVPVDYWHAVISKARGWTGYTHQWREHKQLRRLVMASCDTAADYEAAKADGWRTFRVRQQSEPMAQREVMCPASDEGGNKISCSQCKACCGTMTGRKGDVVIIAHGAASKVKAFSRLQVSQA